MESSPAPLIADLIGKRAARTVAGGQQGSLINGTRVRPHRHRYQTIPQTHGHKSLLRSSCGSVDDNKGRSSGGCSMTQDDLRGPAHRAIQDTIRRQTRSCPARRWPGGRARAGDHIDVAYRFFSTDSASSSSPTRRARAVPHDAGASASSHHPHEQIAASSRRRAGIAISSRSSASSTSFLPSTRWT